MSKVIVDKQLTMKYFMTFKKCLCSWAWWYMPDVPVILALGRLRQEHQEFEVSLGLTQPNK
jgi:hypothetical protein